MAEPQPPWQPPPSTVPPGAVPPTTVRSPLNVLTGRGVAAFWLDLALTLGLSFGASRAPVTDALKYPLFIGIVAGLAFSLVNRVLLQWAVRATVGKLLFGQYVVRRSDGGRPGFWYLCRAWLFSFGYLLLEEMNMESPRLWRFAPWTLDRRRRA